MLEATKSQLVMILAAWNVEADMPTAKRDTIIAFPPGNDFNMARISVVTTHKATNGGRLYRIEMQNA